MIIFAKRVTVFFVVVSVVTLIVWAGGFNFDQRGPALAAWLLSSIGLGLIAATFPFLE